VLVRPGRLMGAVHQALAPAANPFLTLGRPPRILMLSDSMWGAWGATYVADIRALIPDAVIHLQAHSGEYTAMAAAQLATDVKVWARAGNQLPESRLDHWSLDRATLTAVASPTSGKTVFKVEDDGLGFGCQVYKTGIPLPDEGITEGLVFSFTLEAGTKDRATVDCYLNAWSPQIMVPTLIPASAVDAGMPVRYCLTIPPGTYVSGDTLVIDISKGAVGYLYISDPQINVGPYATPYAQTTGAAQAVAAYASVTPYPGIDSFALYDLVCLCFSNDGGWQDQAKVAVGWNAALDAAARRGLRTLLCTPPPKANAGLTAWDDTDARLGYGYFETLRLLAAARGCWLYDAWTDFRARVLAAEYTIGQLMGDTVHATATGCSLYAAPILAAMNSAYDHPPMVTGPASPVARFGGTGVGTWAKTYTTGGNWGFDDLPSGDGAFGVGNLTRRCDKSSTANDTMTYSVSGTEIALIYLVGGTAGVVDVTVDGAAPVRLNLVGGATNYHRTLRITDANGPILYAAGAHTVQVKVVSGDVKLIGCVGMP
jgi:hypothetical protein